MSDDDGGPEQADRRTAAWVLGAAVVTVAAAAGWVLAGVTSLQVLPDEAGVWAVGLFLARSAARIDMAGAPTYSAAAGALMAPLTRLLPAAAWYRAGIVVMELVALGAGWVVWRSRMLGRAGRTTRALAAATVVLLPATVFGATFTWVESLALLFFVVWCSASTWALRRPELWSWCLVGAYAGLGRVVHGRFVLLPLVWIVVAALVERSSGRDRTEQVRRLAAVLASVAVAVAVQVMVQRTVVQQVWHDDVYLAESFDLGSAGPAEAALAVLRTMVGQVWYLGASTAGLAWVGVAALVAGARRPDRAVDRSGPDDLPGGRPALLLVLSCGAVWLVSALFMGATVARAEVPFTRYDHLVYGRYVAPSAAVLAAFGVVVVLDRWARGPARRAAAAVAGGLVAGGAAAWLAPAGLTLSPVFPSVLPGLVVLPTWWLGGNGYAPWGWTLSALAVGGVLLAARWWRRQAFVVALLVVLVVGAASAAQLSVRQHRANPYPALYAPFGEPSGGRATVLVAADAALSESYRWGLYGQQFEMVPKGWTFDLRPEQSADLARAVGPDVGLVVLRQGTDLPGWNPAVTFGDVVLWTPARTG